MSPRYTLEVIAFNIESCILIEQAGAQRIELCDNPGEGGTTPSFGFIKQARAFTSLQLFPIIRPRGGDFLYSTSEFTAMKEDILRCKDLGCDGIVIGILNADGTVHTHRCRTLVQLAYPMEVTFHRAFDRVANATDALEAVIDTGCTRILSSGLHPTAAEGQQYLKEMVAQAGERISIMPGSGIRSSNIANLATATGATEFHTSARKTIPSAMSHNNPLMKENMLTTTVDREEILAIIAALQKTGQSPAI